MNVLLDIDYALQVIDVLVDYCVIPKYDEILNDAITQDEAENILNGLNPDGSPKE